jgi:predicted secreted protein
MGWFTGCVLYLLIWWTVLFAVLPFGTRPVTAADPTSGWRGAPAQPHLLRKAVATTVISALVWAGMYVVISHETWLSFRSGWLALPEE